MTGPIKTNKYSSPWRLLSDFIRLETSAGILLFSAAILAIIIANTPLQDEYDALFHQMINFHWMSWQIAFPLIDVINDFLMSIFFLLVGLEIKREMYIGELDSMDKIRLPGVAAIGGMLVPALIFTAINHNNTEAMRGWAIPTATDIAFALGILMVLGKRIPLSIKLFLMALAIFDDLGAICIIAIFYKTKVSIPAMIATAGCMLLLILLNRFRVKQIALYLIAGLFLWFFMLKSGIHPTLSGVLLAFTIPIHGSGSKLQSPLHRLESKLHPLVAFAILPLFSLANAGVPFVDYSIEKLFSKLSIGIILGLFLGKQIGIMAACWILIKNKWAEMPRGGNWLMLYGVSILAGVGFTMSLFIGFLAFQDQEAAYPVYVRFGVFAGSLLSGLVGYIILTIAVKRENNE